MACIASSFVGTVAALKATKVQVSKQTSPHGPKVRVRTLRQSSGKQLCHRFRGKSCWGSKQCGQGFFFRSHRARRKRRAVGRGANRVPTNANTILLKGFLSFVLGVVLPDWAAWRRDRSTPEHIVMAHPRKHIDIGDKL